MAGCDAVTPCGRCERCKKRRQRRIPLDRPPRAFRQTPWERVVAAFQAYWEAESDEEFKTAKARCRMALSAYVEHRRTKSPDAVKLPVRQ